MQNPWPCARKPLITEGLKGNPRQVKRFLNALFLRKELARVANLTNLKDDVLVKLMILEYTSEKRFRQLHEWQAPQDGHPRELACKGRSKTAAGGGARTRHPVPMYPAPRASRKGVAGRSARKRAGAPARLRGATQRLRSTAGCRDGENRGPPQHLGRPLRWDGTSKSLSGLPRFFLCQNLRFFAFFSEFTGNLYWGRGMEFGVR